MRTASTLISPAQVRSIPLDRSTRRGSWGALAVTLSAVGFGFSPYLATRAFAAGVDPIAASFLRILALFVVLLPCAPRLIAWRRESMLVFGAGAASMLGFAGYFVALDRAPVAAATVVYYTYPVVVLAVSAIVWKRPVRAAEVALALAILIGVVLSVGPSGISVSVMVALAPAIAAPLGWALYLVVLAGPASAMPTAPKILAGAAGGVAVLLPLTLVRQGLAIAPATTDAVVAVAILTVCTLAIPAVLVTWGAPRAGDRATSMIGSFEFVVALSVSWVLMGDPVGVGQFVGGVIVCGAALVAARLSRRDLVT
ncbi:MAG: DMT family transporter [Actinomycetota bacterium]